MSAANKVLLLIIAVAAFGIGMVVNSAKVSAQINTEPLLSAKLMKADGTSNSQPLSADLKKLTLVNFWASWCAPCREEMPIFEAMFRANKNRGFQIVGVTIDSPEKAQAMLDSMDISYPIHYAEQTGMQIMETAGNPQGLLPYSLLLDEDGQVLEQILGRIHENDINNWLNSYL